MTYTATAQSVAFKKLIEEVYNFPDKADKARFVAAAGTIPEKIERTAITPAVSISIGVTRRFHLFCFKMRAT